MVISPSLARARATYQRTNGSSSGAASLHFAAVGLERAPDERDAFVRASCAGDEALASVRRAQTADSTLVVAIAVQGWVHYYARQYAAALPAFARALDRNPEYALVHLWRGWTLEAMDSMPSAIAAHRHGVELSDSAGVYLAALLHALARGGDRAGVESLLRQLDARSSAGRHVPPYEIAKVHAALGRRDEAFVWLERAYTRRSHALALMRVDPQLELLRDDRRYAALERRVYQGQ